MVNLLSNLNNKAMERDSMLKRVIFNKKDKIRPVIKIFALLIFAILLDQLTGISLGIDQLLDFFKNL